MEVKSEKGAALVITMVVLALLGIFTSSTFLSVTSAYRSSTAKLHNTQALYAAESGVNDALWRLNLYGTSTGAGIWGPRQESYETIEETLASSSELTYNVEVQRTGQKYTITSTGTSGSISRTVEVRIILPAPSTSPITSLPEKVILGPSHGNGNNAITFYDEEGREIPRDEAVVEKEPLPTINLNFDPASLDLTQTLIVSHDSDEGPYTASTIVVNDNIKIKGTLIAKGDIIIGDKAVISGDIISLEGNIRLGHNSVTHGDIIALDGEVTYDPNGNGNAYGTSGMEINGLVYGQTVDFGNSVVIHGAVIGAMVEFHNKNEIYYTPENLTSTLVTYTGSEVSSSRSWQLL